MCLGTPLLAPPYVGQLPIAVNGVTFQARLSVGHTAIFDESIALPDRSCGGDSSYLYECCRGWKYNVGASVGIHYPELISCVVVDHQ